MSFLSSQIWVVYEQFDSFITLTRPIYFLNYGVKWPIHNFQHESQCNNLTHLGKTTSSLLPMLNIFVEIRNTNLIYII